jgi:hypothetical protein
MLTLKIGASARDFDNIDLIDEGWINQQIRGLRGDKHSLCIRVTINEGPLNMVLATPDCGSANGGSRPPNADEEKVFDIWKKNGLDQKNFEAVHLIAFLKQIRKALR